MAQTLQQRLYIDGNYVDSKGNERFESINPANGQTLAECQQAVTADIDIAVTSARRGFDEWSKMPAIERSRVLLKAVAILRERNNELADLEVLDTGKPVREASAVDIVTGADVIEYYAGLVPTLQGAH
jgi:betaine-aldehyde dehydrogenase